MQKRKWIVLALLIFVLVAVGGVGMFLILGKQESAPTGNKANIEWYTEDGKEFIITTADELYGLVKLSDYYDFSGQTIKLGADIVVNDGNAEDWAERKPSKRWYPIDGFAGVFDGQGHSISGIYGYGIDVEMGLFSNTKMSSIIKDVKLVNSYFEVDGGKPVGSFASNGCGTFEKLYSDAIIRSNGQKCGGIVGKINDDGTVSTTVKASKMYNCWFDGKVELITRSGIYGGGLIGQINGGSLTIAHCLNSGSLSAECTDSTGIHLGGIFGALTYTYSGSVIVEDTLNVGKIHSNTSAAIGSLGGSARSSKLTMDIKNTYVTDESCESFCTSDASTRTTSPVSINTEFIQGEDWYRYSTLDYEQYWTVTKDSTPILRYFADEVIDTSSLQKAYSLDWFNQYSQELIIDSVEDFYGLAILSSSETFANKIIKLGADIEINEGNATKWASGKVVPENHWIPISRENAFEGIFDGQGHTISGIYGKTNARYMGLFGWCGKYSEVRNLRITNSCFISTKTGNSGLGSVAGRIYGGKFDTIYSDAIIVTTGEMNGGIIGYKTGTSQSEINNCWYEGTISLLGDKSKYGAGIISRLNEGQLIMSNCLFSGKISAFGVKRSACSGGLIGMTAYDLTIKNCLSTGEMEIAEAEGMNSLWCLIGYVSNTETTTVTLENVYYTGLGDNTKYYLYAGGDKPTIKGYAEQKVESEITGYGGFQTTELDFNKYWTVVLNKDDTPILKSFAKKKPSVAGIEKIFDKSWYDPEKSTYILKDSKDLYGLMYLSNSKIDFKDKTILLANDINVNEGLAVDWLNGINIPSSVYNWRGIGRYTTFKGIFDGQGYTISGMYGVADTSKHGLISSLGADGVVKNVRLTNSYFESTATGNTAIGSFVGYLEGNIDTVYSDAIISSKGFLNGGIAGYKYSNKKSSIVNSWYAGSIYMNGDAAKHNGGIIGRLFEGELEISNCLFTGKIYIGGKLRSANTGGFIGCVAKGTLTLNNCLNDGEFEITEAANMNSTSRDIGQVYNDKDAKVIIKDTYFTKKGDRSTNFYYCEGNNPTRIGGSEMKMEDDIKGYDGYRTTSLDFDNYWTVVIDEDDSPILKSFASEVPSVAGLEKIFDKSWYDEKKTTYVLKDRKDLYGMAYLLNSKINFKGKKVTLGNDITVNEVGTADEWLNGTIPTYEWVPMGRNLTFEGTFDGKGYTISGLYGVTDSAYMGFFAYAGASSKIQNLKITNSYFESTMTGYAAIGSVAGRTEGDVLNVYSDAIIKSAGLLNGGIVGYRDSKNQTTFSNCWYAGDIHMVGDASSRTGGIIGHLMNGQLEVDNCLFSGKIYVGGKTRATNTGGFVGYVSKELTLKNSLNTGEFIVTDAKSQNALGRIIGQIKADKTTIVTLDNVYFTNKGARGTYTWYRLEKDTGGNYLSTVDGIVTQVSEEDIMGEYGYYSMKLDFKKYWTTVLDNEATTEKDETGTPVLQNFATIVHPIPTAPTYADISWYDENEITYTLKNQNELLGLSYLSKTGLTFEGKTIEIADTVEEINFSETSVAQEYEWEPIGWRVPFKGTFDGKGVTIRGLEVTDASTSTVGLFGKTKGATIKNLKLTDSNFNGTSTIGSIVGEGYGTFENIYSEVQLNGTKHVGGIVGKVNGNSNFMKCWYEGNISTSDRSAGIIGEISSGTVTMTNCLYAGSLTSSSTNDRPYVSGFVGYVGDSATLSMNTSLATGTITLSDTATHAWKGWAVSYTEQNGGDVTITDSYAYKNGLTRAVGTGSTLYLNTGLEAATIKGDALINATSGLDWEETYATQYNGKAALRGLISDESLVIPDTAWYDSATENKDGDKPGTKNNPYKLSEAAELYGLAKLVNKGNNFVGKYIELTKDITVNNQTIDPTSEGWASLSTELRTWKPIGKSAEYAFQGIFNGKGHTISGLYVSGATDESIGLFGHINGAQIKNLRLTNSYFKGVNQVASIVGQGHGNFENIYSDVRIDAEIQAGGIVGYANGNSDLKTCWYEGTLTTRYHSGGIVGAIGYDNVEAIVTMTNCLNAGIIVSSTSSNDNKNYSSVKASHVKYDAPYVSGFCGYVHDSSQLSIITSLSVGTITLPSVATHNWKGWAVSYTQSSGVDVTITDSYAYKNGLSRAIGIGSSLYLNTGLDATRITGDALKNATAGLNWSNIFILQSNGKPGIKGLFQTNQ